MVEGVSPESITWKALKRHLTAKIERLTTELETVHPDRLLKLQGRIMALREQIEEVEKPVTGFDQKNSTASGPVTY